MKKKLLSVLMVLASSIVSAETSPAKTAAAKEPFSGPYFSDGPVFYLVHEGGPLKIDVKVFKAAPGHRGAPVLRTAPSSFIAILDERENIVKKDYHRFNDNDKERVVSYEAKDARPGIWQIRGSLATNCNLAIDLKTEPRLKYGALLSRCRMLDEDLSNFSNSYFLVPPHVPNFPQNPKWYAAPVGKNNKLHIANRGPQTLFYDKNNRQLAFDDTYMIVGARPDLFGNSNRELPQGTTEVQVDSAGPESTLSDANGATIIRVGRDSSAVTDLKSGEIYNLKINHAGKGYVTLDGFPVILCPDAATAKKINGSVEKGPDGRFLAHKFQARMLEWMNSLKDSDLEVAAEPISKRRKEWLANPGNEALFNAFAHAGHFFKSQRLERGPEFGSSPLRLGELALFCSLDKPYNPYFANKAVMNRTMLYFFRHMLHLTEAGVMFDDPAQGAYCGGVEWTGWESMALVEDYLALAMLAPHADKGLVRLWADALAMQVHRLWSTRLTCENQSLHWPIKLYALHMATKEKIYLDMARDYIRDFADPEMSRNMKTGYPMEAYGLDGTYTGISTSMLAFGARFANDDAAVPALKRIFDLMNHTVVREPDGTLSAANGFAHRTTGTWLERQYDGGTPLMSDRLEEAAVLPGWHKAPAPEEAARKFDALAKLEIPANFEEWCGKGGEVLTRYSLAGWLPYWTMSILKMGGKIENPRLPIEKSDDFERDFNGEFLARRAPSYYAFFYTGNYSWRRHSWRQVDSPFPEKAGIVNGEVYSAQPSRGWMAMQGANIFWTPKFGAFLLARNWTMYSQNLVRFDRAGEVADFPTCYSAETDYDKESKILTTSHSSKRLGFVTRRATKFEKDALRIALRISAPEKTVALEVIEQIPFLVKPDLKFSYRRGGKWGESASGKVDAARVSRDNGAAILMEFGRPVTVRRGYNSKSVNSKVNTTGLLEIVVDDKYDGSKVLDFEYSIKADDSK